MSINFAIKHCGIVYLVGNLNPELKQAHLTPKDFGVVFKNDNFVVGSYESNPVDYILSDNPQWFKLPQNDLSNKGIIVNQIVNPWFKRACDLGLIKEENSQKAFRHIIVYKNKIYQLLRSLFVVEVDHYAAFGQEEQVLFSNLMTFTDDLNIHDFIHDLMKKVSHSYSNYSTRYVVYNTSDHTYHFNEVNPL